MHNLRYEVLRRDRKLTIIKNAMDKRRIIVVFLDAD